jgi:hypothetical protein
MLYSALRRNQDPLYQRFVNSPWLLAESVRSSLHVWRADGLHHVSYLP